MGKRVTYEYQGCVEILIVFLDVVRIVVGCLLLVHCIKVNAGVARLDGLDEISENIVDAASGRRTVIWVKKQVRTYHFGSICSGGESFSPSSLFSASAISRYVRSEAEDVEGRRVMVREQGMGTRF